MSSFAEEPNQDWSRHENPLNLHAEGGQEEQQSFPQELVPYLLQPTAKSLKLYLIEISHWHVSLENVQSSHYQLPTKSTKHLVKCPGRLES